MKELLHNAWFGWRDFIDAGKLAALLLASLIFLWTGEKKPKQETLLVYTTIMTVCCIFPLTAAGLMLYQTKFYDYQWIWSLAPVTAVIACGIVRALDRYQYHWKLAVLLLVVLILCGGLGRSVSEDEGDMQARESAENALADVRAEMREESVCLWAPREVLEYARETDASISLLYGRNMWDRWLNAYVYDTYPEQLEALYQWMEEDAAAGEEERMRESVEAALAEGANCILLPESLEGVEELAEKLSMRLVPIEGYYLLAM